MCTRINGFKMYIHSKGTVASAGCETIVRVGNVEPEKESFMLLLVGVVSLANEHLDDGADVL